MTEPASTTAVSVPELDGKQFAFEAGRVYAIPATALGITVLLFLAAGLVGGFDRAHWFVVLASLLSLPSLFLFPLLTPRDGAKPSRGVFPAAVTLGGFVAYGLGCYLTFYEGLWGFFRLFSDFAFSSMFWSVACLVLGYLIVRGIYRLTELCRAVDEGRIIVRRST